MHTGPVEGLPQLGYRRDLGARLTLNGAATSVHASPKGLTDLSLRIYDRPSETSGPSRIDGEDAEVQSVSTRLFVVSTTFTSVKRTSPHAPGGFGLNTAVVLRVKSALPFCTGKSPAAVTLVLFAACG